MSSSRTLTGSDLEFRKKLDGMKKGEVDRLKTARNQNFRSQHPEDYDYKKHGKKTHSEIDQEKQDLKSLGDFMRFEVMQYAEKEFYKYKPEGSKSGNPWPDELREHMFWM